MYRSRVKIERVSEQLDRSEVSELVRRVWRSFQNKHPDLAMIAKNN